MFKVPLTITSSIILFLSFSQSPESNGAGLFFFHYSETIIVLGLFDESGLDYFF